MLHRTAKKPPISKSYHRQQNNGKIKSITYQSTSDEFWKWLLQQKVFKNAISKHGFFDMERDRIISYYQACMKVINRTSNNPIVLSVPSSFNVEYFSQTPPPLRRAGYYIIRTGNGNCIIFNSAVFPAPFLGLNGLHYDKEIIVQRRGFSSLKKAFSSQWNEQSFIKALHFSGAFGKLVKEICKATSYESGPSGPRPSTFRFFMMDKRNKKLVQVLYQGIDDLDECLYLNCKGATVVIPIEAKVTSHHDLAWHKLAFPCYRFIDNASSFGLKPNNWPITPRIIPVYCMYNEILQRAYLYVFPEIKILKRNQIHRVEKGLILNDRNQLKPKRIYMVNIPKVLSR